MQQSRLYLWVAVPVLGLLTVLALVAEDRSDHSTLAREPGVGQAGASSIQGDTDCNGVVAVVDALMDLRAVAGLSAGGCMELGDVDCDESLTVVDALLIQRFVAGLPVQAPPECPPIGQDIAPTPTPTPSPGPTEGSSRLTLNKFGGGTVVSTPGGIQCGDECIDQSADFTTGATVQLAAVSSEGYSFSYWSGCDEVLTNTCTVTVNSERLVLATFSLNEVIIADNARPVREEPISIDGATYCFSPEAVKGVGPGDVIIGVTADASIADLITGTVEGATVPFTDLLRKVTAVQSSSPESTCFATDEATLGEVVHKGTVTVSSSLLSDATLKSWVKTFEQQGAVQVSGIAPQGPPSAGCTREGDPLELVCRLSLSAEVYNNHDENTPATVTLGVQLTIKPRWDAAVEFVFGIPVGFRATAGGDTTVTTTVDVRGSVQADITLPRFPIFATFPPPFRITTLIGVEVGLSGRLVVSATVRDPNFQAGVVLVPISPFFVPIISSGGLTLGDRSLTLEGEAYVQPYVVPTVDIGIPQITEISLELREGLKFAVEISGELREARETGHASGLVRRALDLGLVTEDEIRNEDLEALAIRLAWKLQFTIRPELKVTSWVIYALTRFQTSEYSKRWELEFDLAEGDFLRTPTPTPPQPTPGSNQSPLLSPVNPGATRLPVDPAPFNIGDLIRIFGPGCQNPEDNQVAGINIDSIDLLHPLVHFHPAGSTVIKLPESTPSPVLCTPTPGPTLTPTATPVHTPTPTATPVQTPTPTATPVQTATPTASVPTPTPTPVPYPLISNVQPTSTIETGPGSINFEFDYSGGSGFTYISASPLHNGQAALNASGWVSSLLSGSGHEAGWFDFSSCSQVNTIRFEWFQLNFPAPPYKFYEVDIPVNYSVVCIN